MPPGEPREWALSGFTSGGSDSRRPPPPLGPRRPIGSPQPRKACSTTSPTRYPTLLTSQVIRPTAASYPDCQRNRELRRRHRCRMGNVSPNAPEAEDETGHPARSAVARPAKVLVTLGYARVSSAGSLQTPPPTCALQPTARPFPTGLADRRDSVHQRHPCNAEEAARSVAEEASLARLRRPRVVLWVDIVAL